MRLRLRPTWLGPDDPFPPPESADEQGLLAVGGDLRADRLLEAYRHGIFPWPLLGEGAPMLWFSPDPRFILYPEELHVGRSLRRTLKRDRFEIRFDSRFEEVLLHCSRVPRPGQEGTWITEPMLAAYTELHRLGYAHSAEAWLEGELAGGLYGVSLGGAFFGESMFSLRPDASKVAFVRLVERLQDWSFPLVDCQVPTEHLASFGARPIPRRRFLSELAACLELPDRRGSWSTGGEERAQTSPS